MYVNEILMSYEYEIVLVWLVWNFNVSGSTTPNTVCKMYLTSLGQKCQTDSPVLI